MTTPQPRPHQVTALADLTRALAVHDRTQLVMACGTGKTFVGRWHAQTSDSEQVLVLLPSLALVAQTLREWRRATGQQNTGWRFRALVVCSDPTTAEGVAERHLGDDELPITAATWDQYGARVTTDPAAAARFLRDHKPGLPQVVFSTYHSSPVVQAAQARSEAVFDLAICDEAHRLAGRPSQAFTTVLDNRKIVARKRVFMTATPKAFAGEDGTSMDDPRLFGPVAHTVTFGEAIAAGLLTDYQVLVVAGRSPEVEADAHTTVPAALVQAIDHHQLRRVLSFHGRVVKAEAFAAHMDGRTTPGGRAIHARHVSGSMKAGTRGAALEWLAEPGDDVRLVSNARCLSEGVDVPAVDGILFADQRSSVVDIIQAIGRVLRPSEGKERGTIILPVTLPDDGDDDTTLTLSAFAHVWTVLRGLRAHDQRLADEIDHATREYARNPGRRGGYRIPRIEYVFPDSLDLGTVRLRTVQEIGSMWERNYALAEQWATTNDGRLMPRGAKGPDGTISIGEWAEQQRIAHRRGLLPADRAARLAQIPGWSWDKTETRWTQTLEILRRYAAEHGTVADHHSGESRFVGMDDADMPRRNLGIWMAAQRQAYRLGTLNTDRATALEQLPGWAWDGGLSAVDVDMVEALRQFVEFEKHANVPDDHLEDGLRLGAWCWAVRRRAVTGHLSPVLYDEVLAATPSKFRAAERFQWEKVETQWRIGYFALLQFTDREGTATPTGRVREKLPDTVHNLGQWAALQRLRYRRGELDQRHTSLLETLPGWVWEVEPHRVEPSEPLELPSGRHGTAMAYQRHACRCIDCLEWRRSTDIARLARKRQLKDPVSAIRVRRHLEQLEAAHIAGEKDSSMRNGRTLIAAISGVSLGVIRKILKGEALQVEREHEARLLATTAEMCAAARTQTGSRGRSTSRLTTKIDPGPTWVLLDDLAGRGFGISWVSRELGYAGALQITRDRKLSARIHDAIAALHTRVGDLVMPDLPKSTARPTLAELLADHNNDQAGAA